MASAAAAIAGAAAAAAAVAWHRNDLSIKRPPLPWMHNLRYCFGRRVDSSGQK